MEDETVNQQMIILTSLKSLPQNVYTSAIYSLTDIQTIALGIFQKEELNGKLKQAITHHSARNWTKKSVSSVSIIDNILTSCSAHQLKKIITLDIVDIIPTQLFPDTLTDLFSLSVNFIIRILLSQLE